MSGKQFAISYFYLVSLIMITSGLWMIIHIGIEITTYIGVLLLICGIVVAGFTTKITYEDN
jgi:hypothetical protein